MTIAEIKELYEGEYEEVEVYRFMSERHRIHTDNIACLEDVPEEVEAVTCHLMDEDDYNLTVNANCDDADFEEWYGNREAKVLVIMLDKNWNSLWYAVMQDKEDTDWGTGSYNKNKAIEMCRKSKETNPDAYIAIIHWDECIDTEEV